MNFLLDIIFPNRCASCHISGKSICKNCYGILDNLFYPTFVSLPDFGLDTFMFAFGYGGVIKKLITDFKYNGRTGTVKFLGHFMRLMLYRYMCSHEGQENIYLIPVQADGHHIRERGFNQAMILAEEVCKIDSRVFILDCIVRNGHRRAQAGLSRSERQTNVKDLFSIHPSYESTVAGSRIILIDDVATTLSTMKECARVLRNAGATSVAGIVLAKG